VKPIAEKQVDLFDAYADQTAEAPDQKATNEADRHDG
jgi:hypothetical protein